MTNILHLGPVPGNRRVGLTAEKPFQGHLLIHGTPKELDVVTHGAPNQLDVTVHGTQKPIDVVMHDTQKPIDVVMHGAQKDLENVSHTPLSSSDDALSDEDPDGLAFSSKNSRASVGASTETLDRERRNLSGSPRPELGVDKSNILPTQFLTTTRRSVSPDDQIFKRPLWVPDDSTVEEWGRKKPKTKNHYGQNGKSFHMPKITRNYSRAGKTKSQPEDNESLLSLCKPDNQLWKDPADMFRFGKQQTKIFQPKNPRRGLLWPLVNWILPVRKGHVKVHKEVVKQRQIQDLKFLSMLRSEKSTTKARLQGTSNHHLY